MYFLRQKYKFKVKTVKADMGECVSISPLKRSKVQKKVLTGQFNKMLQSSSNATFLHIRPKK